MSAKKALFVAAAFAAGVGAIVSRPVEAKPETSRLPLILTSFVQLGQTNVARNEVLVFRFSTPLKKSSVNGRSLQVNEVTPEGPKAAEGIRIVIGNVVLFDPRRSQTNFDQALLPNSTFAEFDRPDGLNGGARFEVRLPVSSDFPVLKSRIGRRLATPFLGTFVTSHICIDSVVGQPSFIGDHGTGLLGFDPPRSPATGLVDSDAVIVLEFSEAVRPESLVPGQTVLVTRITTGQEVAGSVMPDAEAQNGRRFLFVPTDGFGADAKNQQGWDIQIQLTTGITDIAGNALKRPVTLPVFRTRLPN